MPLTTRLLLAAYSRGLFPMADPTSGEIHWYDPDPRAVIPIERAHLSRRLARTVRQGRFEVRVDTAFRAVMRACQPPRPGQAGGECWISDEMIEAYAELHQLGFAHSVEAWQAGALVGGLYGVTVGGLFAGESMFSRRRDAGKVAFAHLVTRLRRGGFVLLDTQFMTPVTRSLGAVEIARDDYRARLAVALRTPAQW